MEQRRTTRRSSKTNVRKTFSTDRISTPPPISATTRALFQPRSNALYFDRRIPEWAIVEKYLKYHKRAIFFFTETHETQYTDNTIVSRPVFRWFDSHWDTLLAFCENELETEKARLRFRDVERSNIYGSNSSNLPRTESPRFSPYVNYNRNLALCIRNDGRIEGFMLIAMGYSDNVELDVLCTGPKGVGIGKLLIRALKRHTLLAGRNAITLTAVPSAISFYRSQGFKGHAGSDDMTWSHT
jgi:hypothetical protein